MQAPREDMCIMFISESTHTPLTTKNCEMYQFYCIVNLPQPFKLAFFICGRFGILQGKSDFAQLPAATIAELQVRVEYIAEIPHSSDITEGALLVYDTTCRQSFINLKNWIRDAKALVWTV